MYDQLPLLEKLYARCDVLLHKRIVPVVVLTGLVLGAWWLFENGFTWAFKILSH